jgi:hypothetical protein
MLPDEVEGLGQVLSKVVQHRYCWLVAHVQRGVFLDLLDRDALPPLPSGYSFSVEDRSNGVPPIPLEEAIVPLMVHPQAMGEAPNGTTYDHTYVREVTLVALRQSVLSSVQSCLEYHKTADLVEAYCPEHLTIFIFLRQARNIVLHADGRMRGRDLEPCSWRGIRIENTGQPLRLSDERIHTLLGDIIEVLARMYVAAGKRLDYVTANLGYGVPFIHECAERMRAGDEGAGGPLGSPTEPRN